MKLTKLESAQLRRKLRGAGAGERSLWLAVLRRAMQDCIFSTNERTRFTASEWLNDRSGDIYSVRWVCDHLDINYVYWIRMMANDGSEEDRKRLKRILVRR